MKVLTFDTADQASDKAFDIFKEALENGATVFGLATGSTPEPLYEKLVASDLDFSNATSINLDEYYGLAGDHPQSYRYYMQEKLFDHKPFNENFLPDGTNTDVEGEIEAYNQILADHPIDLQLLGLGSNGHIGFNEPGTDFEQRTVLADLTDETINANKRFFDSIEDVPTQAFSMGIASIMDAKEIVLMAFGEGKADAVKTMIEGPVTNEVPASILQEHPNVTILLDQAAASKLSK